MAEYRRLEVAEFMVRELDGSVNSALLARPGSGVIYNGRKKAFVPTSDDEEEGDEEDEAIDYDELYEPCRAARDTLLATINKYRKKQKLPQLDPSTKHSWAEVEDSVKAACDEVSQCTAKTKDPAGKLQRGFLWLCQHAGAGQNVSSMLPNDSFNSVLCGGIKIISTGLRQAWLHREEIYRAMEELPTILQNYSKQWSLFKQDEVMTRRIAALYAAIFHLLNQILLWFVKGSLSTGIRIMFDSQSFSDKLKDRISEVKMAAQDFEKYAIILSQQAGLKSLENSEHTRYNTEYTARVGYHVLERLDKLSERLNRLGVLEKFEELLQQSSLAHDRSYELTQNLAYIQNQRDIPQITIEDFLVHFGYDKDMVMNDSLAFQRLGASKSKAEIDTARLKAIQSNSSLRAWRVVDESSLLLFNGRGERKRTSEVSIFSAHLVDALLQQYDLQNENEQAPTQKPKKQKKKQTEARKADLIPLVFFCSQHRDQQNDVNAYAEELGMSLLLQMIHRCPSVDPEVLNDVYSFLNPTDISSICASIEKIICLLDKHVFVYLIVEGLSHFSQPPERREKTRELVELLVGIYRKGAEATLKFLFADIGRLTWLEDLFEEDECVGLARSLRGGG